MNDVIAGVARLVVRLVLVAAGLLFFVSLLAAMLVLALASGLRTLWARLAGRPVAPWAMRIDPRAGWSTVYRSGARWTATRRPAPSDSQPPAEVPAHLRPLPGAEDVTDVQPRDPGRP